MLKKCCTVLTKLLLASSLLLTSAVANADRVTTFVLDPQHSQVRFQWNHLGFSNLGASFDLVAGEIHVNETRLDRSTVDISIIVESLHTHVPALDHLLLTHTDYFRPQDFPIITYVSTGIKNVDLEDKSFDLEGVLSINGIEQPVTLAAQVNKVGPHPLWNDAQAIGVTASAAVVRSEFGMDAHLPLVSDVLDVSLNLEAIEREAYYKTLAEKEAAKNAAANDHQDDDHPQSLADKLIKHLHHLEAEQYEDNAQAEEEPAAQQPKHNEEAQEKL